MQLYSSQNCVYSLPFYTPRTSPRSYPDFEAKLQDHWLGPTKEILIVWKTKIISLDVGTLVCLTVTPVEAFFSGSQQGHVVAVTCGGRSLGNELATRGWFNQWRIGGDFLVLQLILWYPLGILYWGDCHGRAEMPTMEPSTTNISHQTTIGKDVGGLYHFWIRGGLALSARMVPRYGSVFSLGWGNTSGTWFEARNRWGHPARASETHPFNSFQSSIVNGSG